MVTLALIGIGRWGKNFLTTSRLISSCRIKYVCARTKAALAALPKDYIKTTRYTDLFRYPDIEGVIIATPTANHYSIAYDLLQRGYNLLIEKPLAIDYHQALKLQSLQRNNKCQVLVGHTYLYHPAYVKAKALMPKIAPVRHVSFEGLSLGPIDQGLSALWEWGPHGVAMMLDSFSKRPLQVSAWAVRVAPKLRSPDVVFIHLTFPHRASAVVKIGWHFPVKKRRLIIIGLRGSLVVNDQADKQLTYFSYGKSTSRQGVNVPTVKVSYPTYTSQTSLEAELRAFIDAIKTGHPPKTDIQQGVLVTRILALAEQSLSRGSRFMRLTN